MRSIMVCENQVHPNSVYSEQTWKNLEELAGLEHQIYDKEALLADPKGFADVDFLFSTWGMLQLTEAEIRSLFPKLQCVFYAAGSVQFFARPFLNCGVKVFSAWAANGVPVAEYTVAQILLANKGFFQLCPMMRRQDDSAYRYKNNYPGNFGARIGIIGAGMIGKMVIKMLKRYQLEVVTFDPFLPEEKAAELGVKKCSLEELFATCQVVSNHLANNPQTVGMLNGKLFASMPAYATFLNTGRGAQVVEADLVEVLTKRPDLTAVLDVTFPEPPEKDHPFYHLPNCFLTPHIAGSSGDEVRRMAEYMVEEFNRYLRKEPCLYEVTEKMLETMA